MSNMFFPRGLCLLYKASFRRNSFYTSPLQQKPVQPEAFGTKNLSHQTPLQQTFLHQIPIHQKRFLHHKFFRPKHLTTKAFHRQNSCTDSHSLYDPSKKIIQYTPMNFCHKRSLDQIFFTKNIYTFMTRRRPPHDYNTTEP